MSVCNAGKWDNIKLREPLSRASLRFITKVLGFQTMAPVQAVTIPLLLDHKDVVVEAVTGSGKTLAYLVPAFEMMQRPALAQVIKANKQAVVAMVLLPTRELALQVHKIALKYRQCIYEVEQLYIAVQCFIGGRPAEVDEKIYKDYGANCLICTPGRLYELMLTSQNLILKTLEFLILDEGDRLLSMGFHSQIDTILSFLPKQRRTGLFSATQTKEVRELARAGLRNAQVIKVKVQTTTPSKDAKKVAAEEQDLDRPTIPSTLRNFYMEVPQSRKLDELLYLLKHMATQDKCIVYFLTCAAVSFFEKALSHLLHGSQVKLYALHGQLQQEKRKAVFKRFLQKPGPSALLCTDVAARGLDFPDVSHIIQYDPPVDPSTFIHRIGRTARMGKSGQSLVLLTPEETDYIPFMQLRNVPLQEKPPQFYTPPPPKQTRPVSENQSSAEGNDDAADKAGETQKAKAERVPLDNKAYREMKVCHSPAILAVRRAILKDRAILDAGVKACMSFVRAYKEHLCNAIFKFQKLNFVDVFHSYALFRVPKMPELKKKKMRLFLQEEFISISLEDIPYKNPADMERHERQSAKRKAKEEEKKKAKEESIREQKKKWIKEQGLGRKEVKNEWEDFEIEEILQEARLMRKMKRGKISATKVDRIMGETLQDPNIRPWKRHKKNQD